MRIHYGYDHPRLIFLIFEQLLHSTFMREVLGQYRKICHFLLGVKGLRRGYTRKFLLESMRIEKQHITRYNVSRNVAKSGRLWFFRQAEAITRRAWSARSRATGGAILLSSNIS